MNLYTTCSLCNEVCPVKEVRVYGDNALCLRCLDTEVGAEAGAMLTLVMLATASDIRDLQEVESCINPSY